MRKTYNTCPMRTLEADRIAEYLEDKSTKNTTLIGACCVTREVEDYVINALNDTKGDIIIYGCISKKLKELAEARGIEIIRTHTYPNLIKEKNAGFEGFGNTKTKYIINEATLCNRQYEKIARRESNFFQRIKKKKIPIPFLVIARGCNNACSYCNSRFHIGKLKSKSIETIKKEYLSLLTSDYKFINIIAGDVGSYGIDTESDFSKLLTMLDSITEKKDVKWMIDGLQAKWLIKYKDTLANLIAKKRISTISVPVQSGSNRILKLMNRETIVEDAIKVLQEFKKLNSKLYLQGIFIVGFPTETEEDFELSVDFVKKVRFNDTTFIPYSEFETCHSSKITPKISREEAYIRFEHAKKALGRLGIDVV